MANSLTSFITFGAENSDGVREEKQINFEDNNKELLQKLEIGQWKGLEYLYDIEPQSQNLFYAGYFCEAGDGSDEYSIKMFYNAAYRIKKVSIPFPSIEVEYHPETRAPLVKNVTYNNEISIDWFEDVYHSVQKYHLDWFNRWYSREYDCFRCGIKGKFRKMALVAFHYKNKNKESIIPIPEIEPLFAFIIGGLIPKTIPSMNFDYGSDGNDQLLSMSYGCGPIRWVYSNKTGRGDDEIYRDKLFKYPIEAINLPDEITLPIQGSFDVNSNDNINWERLRVVRAATYYQAAEGSI
jgi:hypothetical protein